MADAKLSAGPSQVHAHTHPMANPGYGKRSAPNQLAPTKQTFAHLPRREAAVAAYIDRLADGSDISVKTLAKVLPYGQCALRTALNRLARAGHLRRGREHLKGSNSARWVTRTWFSRTAREDSWWTAFAGGELREDDPPRPTRSRALILLAALGRTAPALSLSAAECASLEPLVSQWFTRGATEAEVLRALTTGLPDPIHSPAALTRNRLLHKIPLATPAPPPALRILECDTCGAPGRPQALPGGTCASCRGERAPSTNPAALPPSRVHAHAQLARRSARATR
ncbi:hypothetical protein [Streptomyces sp. NBC_00690]|uniref:hypothetical protein n=1 Tax=Streptomyces sp. NBC_00690 TaxID=2975808 RepID=UPI002E29EBA9|nr:hypothetical protein [Streptomyces sp. NBC_00690]